MRRVFGAALLAGLIAGLLVSLLQEIRVVPLILRAETFEAHSPATPPGHASHDHGSHDAWAPQDGWERRFFTLMANIVTAAGFGLLLTAAYALRGGAIGAREGILWGLAGFCAFTLAPSLGLPPQPPGIEMGELTARQAWWAATAAATAAGLALLVFRRGLWWKLAGAALLLLPHAIGAPDAPAEVASAVPARLAIEFAVASIVTAGLFWAALGALTGEFYRRFY